MSIFMEMDENIQPVFITPASGCTSQENVTDETSASNGKVKEANLKRPEDIMDCCTWQSKKRKQTPNGARSMTHSLCTARSLVRYVQVTPLLKSTRNTKPSRFNKARPSLQEKSTWEPIRHEEFGLQVNGSGHLHRPQSFQGLPEERPDWTATTHDMTKDLTQYKINICRDLKEIPQNIRVKDRDTLIKTLANLPSHTILVKWKLSFNFPSYTPRIVFGILSRFGRIETMGTLSHNSAFVAFHWEYHACRAIMARLVGFSCCPLILRWMFIERYKYALIDASDVKREDLLLSDGRQERNTKRHIATIKRDFWRKAAYLSYDVSTFRP